MRRLLTLSLLMIGLAFYACKKDQKGPDYPDPVFKPSGNLADLVHNPVRPDGSIDSSFLPIMLFKDTLYEFGTVNEGEVISKDFFFTNTGTAPLLITNATSTCGCTIPEWPKDAIAPDSSGKISVKFNTLNRTGAQLKEVTIFANSYPSQHIVRLQGRVVKQ